MGHRHVLILGGTGEARDLAARLDARADLRVTLSLAGRTRDPAPQAGQLRIGGFGGAEGLARHLGAACVDVLVDATHPFARQISENARAAAESAGVPLLVLRRRPWAPVAGDRWIDVPSVADAVPALGAAPRHVFLAIGRQELAPFRAAPWHKYLVRSIDPTDELPGAEYLTARGPFAEADERRLLTEHRIEVIVAKNSGGDATYGKIAAARALGLPVILVQRPPDPQAARTVDEAVELFDHLALAAKRGV